LTLLDLSISTNFGKRRLILRARGRTKAPLVGEVGLEKLAAEVVPTPAAPVSSISVLIFIFNECENITDRKQVIILSSNPELNKLNVWVYKYFIASLDS